MTVTGVINGREYALDDRDVVARLAAVEPDPVRDHYVVVDGRRFPPKQVVATALGLDRADFTTYQARTILRRLGFIAGRRGAEPAPSAPPAPTVAPRAVVEVPLDRHVPAADALRRYVGLWVATRDGAVVASGASPRDVLLALERADTTATSMFRVPLDPARDVLGG